MDHSDVAQVIEQLVKAWPKEANEPEGDIRNRLRGKIVESLPLSSLRTVPAGTWRVTPPLVHAEIAKCVLVDTSYPGTRVLAQFQLRPQGWLLMSFDAECPVCFGTGVNDERICDLCFGTGWGTYVQQG